MKKITVASYLFAILFICSCKNGNDTTTNMPDSGYKQRTDSATMPVVRDELPRGAVAADSIKNGQAPVVGVPDSANNKKDSSGNK